MGKLETLKLLGDWVESLSRVVTEAFNTYQSGYRLHADVHTPRSRSSLTNDHMVHFARQHLAEGEFTHLKKGQRNLFDYKGQILLHFKKLSRAFRPSNYPTQLALQLYQDGTADALPGIPPRLPIMTVGYVLKPNSVGIEGVFLTHIQGSIPQWVHRLDDDAASSSQSSILPIAPYVPDSPASAPRIRSKAGSVKRQRGSRKPSAG